MKGSKKGKARNLGKEERMVIKLRKELGIKTIDEVKRAEISRALVLTKGDKQLTAALLGIGKTTVYRSLSE
jgi:transcriptional regulator of acetoin/glycerol metabolism